MKKNKKQLHEALAVLLTKLSSARDNPLLMDNYVTKALRTVLLDFKESGELHEAYKEQIQSTLESDNPWVAMMMKSIGADPSIKEGKVVDNQPHINTGIATISSSGQPMRDVTIEVEGKQTIYTIPEHLGVTFAGETVLATDKADLLPEVGKLVNEADEIIKAYEPSKERKAKGEELLAALNPAIKEKQETEKRFKALEGDISGIRGMVKQLLDKLG